MIRSAFLVLLVAAAHASLAHADEASVQELRKERLSLLAQRLELIEARLSIGRSDLPAVLAARADYLDALLELAEAREERIDILRKAVANAEERLKFTEQMLNYVGIPGEDLIAAKIELLNRKIALELETDAEATP